ncbi:unnamed protein product [Durusdinium trenchii]|uniref:Uncharacterized protein n=1 Tax=Durusdinium trenchii TaxID=1381693 RepID=A0ABP0KUC5_9DINO
MSSTLSRFASIRVRSPGSSTMPWRWVAVIWKNGVKWAPSTRTGTIAGSGIPIRCYHIVSLHRSFQRFGIKRKCRRICTFRHLLGWLLRGDIPNAHRRFRILSAMLDTDWYFPAHPWHAVVELPKFVEGEPVIIPAGEPLCRLTPVRRGSYSAAEMRPDQFKMLYEKGQAWLEENGRPSEDPEAPAGALDIRGCYARQQRRFDFQVTPRGAPHAARAAGGVRPA